MNLGHLTVKADTHVIEVLGPYLDLSPDASPKAYEQALKAVHEDLGMDPLTVDQVVWYTEASPDDH